MKEKEWKKQKKRIKKILDYWIENLGLKWYKIEIYWKTGDGEERGNGYRCVAICNSKWEYRSADLTFWLDELQEKDDETLESTIVHELCHIFAEQMRIGKVTKQEEYMVENLANAFLWVAKSKRKK